MTAGMRVSEVGPEIFVPGTNGSHSLFCSSVISTCLYLLVSWLLLLLKTDFLQEAKGQWYSEHHNPPPKQGPSSFSALTEKTLGRISIGFDFTLHSVFEAGKKSGTVFGRPVMTPKSLAKRKRGDPTRREGMWRYAMKQNVRCHSQL